MIPIPRISPVEACSSTIVPVNQRNDPCPKLTSRLGALRDIQEFRSTEHASKHPWLRGATGYLVKPIDAREASGQLTDVAEEAGCGRFEGEIHAL